ncbi:Asp-tRNA(Asn)/Glu-tRNA(Gln) amidotransferase subunit GatC [Mycoplasmopsis sturni]|uniref:Asp-tRNA(Asn)/Glu-tRNA(Gln) amidotransferase subunit GatC n=1 Tax=Mycoplasmopsis sturni TaxID=39047 RepID=UPI00055F35C0|nr:Asp-tRNA(Asn)/Glu-tRNA(Gln) amidotransferase subunit GatC [Mycoplasmopsis sturni]
MKEMTKEQLKEIVSSIMFEPSEAVLDNILENWMNLQKELKKFDKLDLVNVKPLTHLNEEPLVDFLREDIEDTSYSISREQILQNAKDSDEEYIITTRVVK